jgi:hypothetical protein
MPISFDSIILYCHMTHCWNCLCLSHDNIKWLNQKMFSNPFGLMKIFFVKSFVKQPLERFYDLATTFMVIFKQDRKRQFEIQKLQRENQKQQNVLQRKSQEVGNIMLYSIMSLRKTLLRDLELCLYLIPTMTYPQQMIF